MYICLYVYIYVYMYICIYVHVFIYVYIYTFAYMCACMCVWHIYIFVCACLCVCWNEGGALQPTTLMLPFLNVAVRKIVVCHPSDTRYRSLKTRHSSGLECPV